MFRKRSQKQSERHHGAASKPLFARLVLIAALISSYIIGCASPAHAVASTFIIDQPASLMAMKELRRIMGDRLPPDATIFERNLLEIVLVLRVQSSSLCIKDACLTLIIDIRENHGNYTSVLSKAAFTLFDEFRNELPGEGVFGFEGPNRWHEVSITDETVVVK